MTGTGPPEDKGPAEIAAEIGHTRAEMSQTVDALQKKLAPDRLVDDFLDTVRDSLDRNSERILDTMRQHPVVTSLVGLGLGWLLLQSGGRTRTSYSGGEYGTYGDYEESRYDEKPSLGTRVGETAAGVTDSLKAGVAAARDKAGEFASGTRDQAAHIADRARDQASHLVGQAGRYARNQAGYLAGRAREQASHLAGEAAGYARDQAGNLAGRAREQLGHVSNAARDGARRAAGRVGDVVYENPFAVAAVGLALGAAVGFLLPETRKEDELMGEARDTLLDKAKGAASDTMRRVQHVAEAAKDAAMDEAQKQNLTMASITGQAAQAGKNLMDKAEHVVKSAVDAGKEDSKRQGLGAPSAEPTKRPGQPTGTGGAPTVAPTPPEGRKEGCGS